MQEVLIFASAIAPIILAAVELVKRSTNLPKRWVPLVSFLVGMFVGFAAEPFTNLELSLRLWAGALAGLSATGLFELVKINKPIDKD